MLRDQKADEPVQALVHVVLSRRQPRAAPRPEGVRRQIQGQVRRRLRGVPRVGAAAHDREGRHARGHAADADQSAARGQSRTLATRCGRGTRSTPTRRSCSPAWPRCTPASPNTPTSRSAASSTTWSRPGSSTTRSSSTARTTARRVRERPNGSVNENKFFNGYPDELSENMKYLDKLGEPRHLQPLPDGLGGGVLHAVPDVQALLAVRRRHLRPAGDLTGRKASRRRARCVTSTTTPPTSCRPSSTSRPGDARRSTAASSSIR